MSMEILVAFRSTVAIHVGIDVPRIQGTEPE